MIRVMAIAATIIVFSVAQGAAETARQLGPHQHGHGTLHLAVEGQTVQMELEVPGDDIVGFEHKAETAEDRAKIEAAEKTLAQPLALFALPRAAECKLSAAKVSNVGATESGNDAHEHDHHDPAGADEQDAGHSEFHAEYELSCTNVAAITAISFPYFEVFPSSAELAVTLITETDQRSFEVNREHPLIDIRGMM